MQQTITESIEARFDRSEPKFLSLIRNDARIRSVTVTRTAAPTRMKQHNNLRAIEFGLPSNAEQNSFLVTDLLEDITYLVCQAGSLSLLVFRLNNEQVEVAVQPGSDLVEIAYDFTKHLEAIRTNT